jgi:hypothetical protein
LDQPEQQLPTLAEALQCRLERFIVDGRDISVA